MKSFIISEEYEIWDPRRWLYYCITCLAPNVCFSKVFFFFFFYTIVNHLHGKDVFVGGPPVVQAP